MSIRELLRVMGEALSDPATPTAPHPPAMIQLAAGLQAAGFEIREMDLDLVAGRAVVRVHRFDGRWLYLVATAGGASIERWHRDAVVTRYRGGPECDGHRDQFLGRTRYEGARSALRALTTYLSDNPAPGFPRIEAAQVRALFAPLMQADERVVVKID